MRSQAKTADDVMTVAELGVRLKMSRASAYRLVASGVIDRTFVGAGRATRITEAALAAYLARQTKPARKAA